MEVSVHWKWFDLKTTLVAELLFVDFSDGSLFTYATDVHWAAVM